MVKKKNKPKKQLLNLKKIIIRLHHDNHAGRLGAITSPPSTTTPHIFITCLRSGFTALAAA